MDNVIRDVLSTCGDDNELTKLPSDINLRFLENVEKLSCMETFQSDLAACGTRMERIHVTKKYFEWIPLQTDSVSKYKKNAKISCLFRENANRFYSAKNYNDALKCYNLVITFAPDEENLAYAYANRAATLLAMRKANEALEDLNLAVVNKYPRKLMKKLDDRRIKCHEILDQDNSNTSQDTYKKCTTERERRKKYCDGILFRVKKPSNTLRAAEEFVQVSIDPNRGRQLIVSRDIPAGTVLLVEEPFVTVLKNSLTWDMEHCHFCLRRIFRGIPCPSCVFVIYCDENCRLEALKEFHAYECPCMAALHCQSTPRYILLALRIVFKLGPDKLFNIFTGQDSSLRFTQDKVKVSNIKENTIPDPYVTIHQLVDHADDLNPIEIYANTLNALILTHLMVNCTTFFDKIDSSIKNEFVDFVASIVLLHIENVPCNSIGLDEVEGLGNISLWDSFNSISPTKLSELIRLLKFSQYAAGVYGTSSLMNHSCESNVTRIHRLNGGTLAVVASRALKKDEEILTNYSRSSLKDELEHRQHYLLNNYYFKCECIACVNDWPQLPEMMLNTQPTFSCPKCSINIYHDDKICESKFRDCILSLKNNHTCRLCGQQYSLSTLKSDFEKNIELFFQAYDLVLQNLPLHAIRILTGPLKFFQNYVVPPYNKYYMIQSVYKQALELIVHYS